MFDQEINPDGAAVRSVGDLRWVPDGSLLIADTGAGRIWRFVDDNQDGDFDDAGELRVVYDEDEAALAGTPDLGNLITLRYHVKGALE